MIGAYLASGDNDAAQVAFHGLFALQHRGQESAGIAASDGRTLRNFTNQGLVSNAFRQEDLDRLPGHIAIGHTRYSTTGSSSPLNSQPIVSKSPTVELALAHNGNVINAADIRQRLLDQWGVKCTTGTDSEVVAHTLAWAPGGSWEEKTAYLMRTLKGAYSLHGDMDKYWSVVVERLTFLFQAIGFGLGHADWVEAKADDYPELAARYRAKVKDLAGYPLGWMLDACRDAVQPFFDLEEWIDQEIYDPLIEVLERLLNQNGMYTRAHGDGIYVDMPYTGFHDL